MAKDRFTPQKFMARYGASLVLVFVTYNPSGWSYFHWITAEEITRLPLLVLIGLMLLACFIIFLRATMRSIGPVGIILSLAVLGALIWLLADIGLVDLAQGYVLTVVVELVLATVMAVGISWSHIRRRLSGQLDVDDTDA